MEFRRYTEAVTDLDRAIEMRPDLIYPRKLRAQCLRLLGEVDLAAEAEQDIARRLRHSAPWAAADPFSY